MIYFDSAATTLQKPPTVVKAIETAMFRCGNPGRSGHQAAMQAAKTVYECRETVCALFNTNAPERVIFTMNATHALNLAIKSTLKGGGHAVVSGYEHNSVVRPLEAMKEEGVSYSIAAAPLFESAGVLEAVRETVTDETKCVVINHMSNVFGFIQPIEEVDRFCHERGIDLIIDASQSAGVMNIDASALRSVTYICMPGHKSLYGPQGTGILLCVKERAIHSLMQGGTGSNSMEMAQPDFLPDALESGTLNVPGIAGLNEGIRYIRRYGIKRIAEHKYELLRQLNQGLGNIPGVKAYYSRTAQNGLIAFTSPLPSEEMCARLGDRGFCLRGGLHCAPIAHRSAGTLPDGASRISLSIYNDGRQINQLLAAINQIAKGAK